MKKFSIIALVCILTAAAFAQAPPNAFETTTFSFNLTPVSLPNLGASISGAETDALFPLTANNRFGETTLIGESTFIGGRYDRAFPSVAKYLQNHTSLTGGNFEAGVTSSLGVVKAAAKTSWGGRAGFFLRYAPAGSTSFNIGFEAQANYLPNYAGPNTQHWNPSIAIGPNFRF
jgi:hypothetical protein